MTPPLEIVRADEFDTLWRTVYGEARGESLPGQVAVTWVILNRVKTDLGNDGKPDWWGEGVIGVCRKPRQFSCWNASDPNARIIELVKPGAPGTMEVIHAVTGVLIGRFLDPTGGATHYHASNIHPSWAEGQDPTARIGRHVFYRL